MHISPVWLCHHPLRCRCTNPRSDCPDQIRTSFLIPECHGYIPESYSGWKTTTLLKRFPEGYTACNILITQRIPPFPESARHALINKYCPPSLADNIKSDVKNFDCLVRPYLGRRKLGQRQSRLRVFSLRNYPLHVDQMEDLGLAVLNYSAAIATVLAFMYWRAKIDANDVEFVLAPARGTAPAQFQSKHLGDHNLWILDFDCCRSMSMDEEGVKQAAQAFLRNDPFYPCPGRENEEDKKLWAHFKAEFLNASSMMLGAEDQSSGALPSLLMYSIEGLVQEQNSR